MDHYNGEDHQDVGSVEDHQGILVAYEGGHLDNQDDSVAHCQDVLDDYEEDPWVDTDGSEGVLVAKVVSSLTLACSRVELVAQDETDPWVEVLALLNIPPQDCTAPLSCHTALLAHSSH